MFQIDVKSRKAIYEQVADYFKELIITGVLKPGDKAPSVRELSKQLTINPNTIQKAYKELERTGYFYSMAGLGSFVADRRKEETNPARVRELQDSLRAAVSELIFIGFSEEEIRKTVEAALGHDTGGERPGSDIADSAGTLTAGVSETGNNTDTKKGGGNK